jgi:serine/threonine protein kinase
MATDARIGTTIAGYRIESVLGRGGMGVVYLAEQASPRRKVALKVLPGEQAADPAFRERFIRESDAAAAIEHPNIVPIHQAGEQGGVLFIAMRYVEGMDLRSVLEREGPLPAERVVSIVEQVADALDAAHEAGLVHRDVKPGNVLVGRGDHAYLTDFGLFKRPDRATSLTRTGQFMGTVDYVAPEQIRGEPVDGRADVYSLGCLLYECLSGKPPFPSDLDVTGLYAHLEQPPPKVTASRPELPAAIDAVVAKAMAKRPEERFQSAGALATAAREAVGPTPGRVLPPSTKRRVLKVLGGAAAVVAAIAILSVLLVRGGGNPGSSPPPGSPSATAPSTSAIGFAQGVVSVDPKTGAISAPIAPVGTISPQRIVAGEGAVWTIERATVVRIDPTSGRSSTIPVGEQLVDISVGQGAIWALGSFDVIRIDPATHEVVDKISLPTGAGLGIQFVLPVPGGVWITGPGGSLSRIDAGTDRVRTTLHPVTSIDGVAFGLGALWVLNDLDGALLELDPRTGDVRGSIRIGGNPSAITVGLGSIWAADSSGTVTRYDPAARARIGRIRVGEGPTDITTGFGAVWVTNHGDETLSRIDPVVNDATEIPVGEPVGAVAADPVSRQLWVVVAPPA